MPNAIPFVGPAYTLDSLDINCQRCLNWYPEIDNTNSKAVISLKPCFGLLSFAELNGVGNIRGLYSASNERFFGICGNTFNEIFSNGSVVTRGNLTSTTGIVKMVDNGLEVIIVDGSGGLGYTFNFSTNTFAQITDVGYPGGSHVAFIDQYMIVNKPGTQQFQWSDLADARTWPGLNIASSEGSPDVVNSLINLGGELWVFGPQSYSVHVDSDGVFVALPGSTHGVGNAAPFSLAKSDNNIFWLGGDDGGWGRVYVNEGYGSRPISTNPIEQAIQRYSKIDDAIGFCYQKLGHEFYQISFPTPSVTWVYDSTTDMWHEECYTSSSNLQYMARGIVQDFAFGKVFVGDWKSNKVFEVNPDVYTHDGELIVRERSSPHIWDNMDRTFYGSFQIDLESGVGLISGQGEDPQIMLQMSDDGGHTWGVERWRSAGKFGEFKKRVIWRRLGKSRDRVFRVRCTDPVKWVILGAYIEAEK